MTTAKVNDLHLTDLFRIDLIANALRIDCERSELTLWFDADGPGQLKGLKYVRRVKDWRVVVEVFSITSHTSGTSTTCFWSDIEPTNCVRDFWECAINRSQMSAFDRSDNSNDIVRKGLARLLNC